MMNVGQMLDCFGVDDPPTRTLAQWLLECMVSRDAGIMLMILLLIFPTDLKGYKPSDVDQNRDGMIEWSCGGGYVTVGPC